MSKCKNKVCFIQSEEIFQEDTRKKYLKIKNSQLLTSNDGEEIYSYIRKHVRTNKIYNFLLHIDSATLSDLLDYMEDKKQSSKIARAWLKKCAFVCTYSNAGYIRQKVLSLNVKNVFFGLSPIRSVLETIPRGTSSVITNTDGSTTNKPKEIMVVVSNTPSPFFDEVYNSFNDVNTTLQKTKVLVDPNVQNSGLTLQKLNEFAENDGYLIVLSLDTEAEYNAVGSLIKNSNFSKMIHIIECTQILSQGLADMRSKCEIVTSASGVSIQAMLEDLNRTIPYESCAASLCLTWKTWPLYVSGKVVNRPMALL